MKNLRPLGELEQAVMDAAWRSSPLSVHDAGQMLAERGLAYTTLMTTMDRLFKKGLLAREKRGHAFLYRPAIDRDAFERRLVAAILESLPTASKEALLSGFLDYATTDDQTLSTLERLLADRKREEG